MEVSRIGPQISGKYASDSSSGRELTDDMYEGGFRSLHTHYVASEFGKDDKTVESKSVLRYSPTATDSTVALVKALVLLAPPPDGLVVLVSENLVLAIASAGASDGSGVANQARREDEWDESTLGADTIRTNFTEFVDNYDGEEYMEGGQSPLPRATINHAH